MLKLAIISLLSFICWLGGAQAQTSPNTPSGYSIDGQTGNLISNSALTSDTGWAVTTGSPTWTPVSPSGSFGADGYTFSYIREELGVAGINLGSFNHGYLNSNAVFVTGFSYGLTYRFPCANSIGTNCDGTSQTAAPANPTQDNLRVEVGYYPATGSATFYVHQLGLKNINDGNPAYNPTWQTLAETVTFAGAKPLSQAGAVNMGIVGNDAGNWACLGSDCYGPQVKNAYIRANYSVDPCILNPAFNPNCPGFNTVIQGVQSPVYWHSYNIAQRLPHIGGGVQLHGFEYGFNWSNYGACYNTFMFWCTDWRTDGGATINFNVTDKNNNVLYSDSQYRAGNNQSGSYYNRFLFTETRNTLDMGNVNWWLSGVWNHLAVAGWTRPIWTPDPCYSNGLYSPNCSNFQETLKQVVADIKEQQEKISAQNASVTSSTSAPGGTITTLVVADAVNPSVTVTTDPNQSLTTTQVTQSGKSESESQSSTTSLALGLIRNNERREQATAMQASRTAIEQASQQAQRSQQEAQSVAEAAQQEGQKLSASAADQAQLTAQQSAQSESRTTAQVSTMPSMTPNTGPVILQQPSSTVAVVRFDAMQEERRESVQSTQSIQSAAAPVMLPPVVVSTQQQDIRQSQGLQQNISGQTTLTVVDPRPEQSQTYTPPPQTFALPEQPKIEVASISRPIEVPAIITPLPSVNMLETALPAQPMPQPVEVRIQEVETATSPTNFTTNRTNPITEIVEGRPRLQDTAPRRNELETVNKSAPNNELAGGVSIESIATAPQGFNVYASLVLRDAAFYAPKEIYRGQRNVDNVRALRNLAQDARHQEMIEQQYRR
jgi:hypothetical protein